MISAVHARARWAVALAPVIALLSVSATDKPGDLLKQNGPWKMDYATNACHLSATFGEGKNEVKARFTRTGPQDSLRVTLMGLRLGYQGGLSTRAQLEFRPTSEKSALSFVTHGSVGPKNAQIPVVFSESMRLDNMDSPGSSVADLPQVTADTEKAVSGLYVKLSGREPFTLDLVSMAAPMAAMRACTDDLVRSWGFDPAEIAARPKRAEPASRPGQWAQTDDYPDAMLARGTSAIVDFRLLIDETGAVANCFVLSSTTPATIGPYSCDVIKRRAKFTPSLDKDGKPVKDYYINRIFWRAN